MRRVLCAAALILFPVLANAGPIQFLDFGTHVGAGGINETGVTFDATGARAIDDAQDVNGDPLFVCHSNGACDSPFPAFFTLAASPLVDFNEVVDPNGSVQRFYRYGPGTLSMDSLFFGAPLHLLTVSVEQLTIGIHDSDIGQPEPHTWVGNSAFPGEGASAVLGQGALSREFADLLGVPRIIVGGTWNMDLDDIQFFPASSIAGDGMDNGGRGLSIAVPEPTPVVLLLVALLGVAARGRRPYAALAQNTKGTKR